MPLCRLGRSSCERGELYPGVVYANSILGARTTRHGTESALAASLLGLVPEFGVLVDENQRGTLRVEVTAELSGPTDWGALGYYAGQAAGLGIPVFDGVPRPSQDEANADRRAEGRVGA
ncbi:MAG: DUF521 domain-containing protein [Anaerolineae bacterium]|nr:DUF521 domain-containing protein [Anaerolineae bacterium]